MSVMHLEKSTWMALAAVAAGATLAAIAVWLQRPLVTSIGNAVNANAGYVRPSLIPLAGVPAVDVAGGTAAGKAPVSPTYAVALDQYRSRRLQVDNGCAVQPNQQTYKQGTTVMLDNRSEAPVEVTLDGRTYSLRPFTFRMVTLRSTKTPVTLQVDCRLGGKIAYNVARLLIQP